MPQILLQKMPLKRLQYQFNLEPIKEKDQQEYEGSLDSVTEFL